MTDIKQLEQHARKILEQGQEGHRDKDRARLQAAIEKKRAKREADMIAAGSTPEEARAVTTAEAEKVCVCVFICIIFK